MIQINIWYDTIRHLNQVRNRLIQHIFDIQVSFREIFSYNEITMLNNPLLLIPLLVQ